MAFLLPGQDLFTILGGKDIRMKRQMKRAHTEAFTFFGYVRHSRSLALLLSPFCTAHVAGRAKCTECGRKGGKEFRLLEKCRCCEAK